MDIQKQRRTFFAKLLKQNTFTLVHNNESETRFGAVVSFVSSRGIKIYASYQELPYDASITFYDKPPINGTFVILPWLEAEFFTQDNVRVRTSSGVFNVKSHEALTLLGKFIKSR